MPITTIAGTPPAPVPLKTATRALGLHNSVDVVRKGLRSGVIPDLLPGTICAIASRPIVTSLTTPAGAAIPVQRLGDLTPDTTTDPRPYSGFHLSMSATDLTAASVRWWTQSGKNTILQAGCYPIVNGGVGVGWIDLNTTSIRTDATTGRIAYDGHLVAHLTAAGPVVTDPSSSNRNLAVAVLGARFLGGQGGIFTSV